MDENRKEELRNKIGLITKEEVKEIAYEAYKFVFEAGQDEERHGLYNDKLHDTNTFYEWFEQNFT